MSVCLWCVCGTYWMCEFPHTQAFAPDLDECQLSAIPGGDGCNGSFGLLGGGERKLLERCHVVTEGQELG